MRETTGQCLKVDKSYPAVSVSSENTYNETVCNCFKGFTSFCRRSCQLTGRPVRFQVRTGASTNSLERRFPTPAARRNQTMHAFIHAGPLATRPVCKDHAVLEVFRVSVRHLSEHLALDPLPANLGTARLIFSCDGSANTKCFPSQWLGPASLR